MGYHSGVTIRTAIRKEERRYEAHDHVQRAVLARNITAVLQSAVAEMPGAVDPRTLNTVRDLVWAIAVCGSTRLKELAQVLWRRRRARNVRNVETALSKSLKHARYDETALFHARRRQVLRQIPSRAYERYRIVGCGS